MAQAEAATAGQATAKKWVYRFEEGLADMRDLLGGKGAGCAQMTRAGLPVPPGFTITTEACNAYYEAGKQFPPGMWDQTLEALRDLERKTGKGFGDRNNPLLVSVRSGARISMPGMMDTVLNLGLNHDTVQGVIALTGNERFAYDAYRRFIQMFGRIVQDIPAERFDEVFEDAKHRHGAKQDTDLDAAALREVVAAFKDVVQRETGKPFPTDPIEQLRLAIAAVFESWMGKRAVDYRNFYKIPHDLGTAVNVQTMVFGNMGDDSGTGVAFTRDPNTGKNELYGEFLVNAQGEDVVAGIRTPMPISKMAEELPQAYSEFQQIAERLEATYHDMQDMEFTVERGKLYMLQTRAGKRSAPAAVKIAVDMVHEGLITREDALLRVEPDQVQQLLLPRFLPQAVWQARERDGFVTKGLNASPGAAVGKAVFDADRAQAMGQNGERVILVRPETSPDDVHGLIAAQGVLTARGGMTSHAAVVARGMGKPAVVGADDVRIDLRGRSFTVNGRTVNEGDWLSLDGSTGEVFAGQLATIEPNLAEEHELAELLSWADQVRRLGIWANADYPRDAERAREFGAEGIGLCRTEHMFMEEERLPLVQQMILAAPGAARAKAALGIDERRRELQARRMRQTEEHAPPDMVAADLAAEEAALANLEAKLAADSAWQQYKAALDQLLPIQRGDFKGLLKEMAGRPVIIRLLDPPLHEFLPKYDDLLVEVTELRVRGNDPARLAEAEKMLAAVNALREANPMLGLRGVRLGLLYPEINEMQVRAILEAAVELKREGVDAHPEIMIPLIGNTEELRRVETVLRAVAQAVQGEAGTQVDYKFGTMIEIPRAAFIADQIAEMAEFFSFGTNDLTQMIFGFSRDDAEGKFLGRYIEEKILAVNPFETLDRAGVGELICIAVERGRRTRPDLEIGICGEHGGDPASIAFCHAAGLNYVSCSPFRVPVARLAAAQAALQSKQAAGAKGEADR
ncbi:MAG TPA: pyruvate, phosphate dikinase [Chloroflexota bacterium]|nr:pyruvate, phosphate dikinase [Chloroflexota bacterium]